MQGQQVVIRGTRRGVDRDTGLDRAGLPFQIPVAAECRVACCVRTRGDVGAGQVGQHGGRLLARRAFAEIATVDQDIGVRGQVLLDRRELLRVILHRLRAEHGGTDVDLPFRAVGDQVDRIDLSLLLQDGRHLLQAVLVRIEDDDARVRIVDALDERLVVPHRRIDEHDFVAYVRVAHGIRHAIKFGRLLR